MPAATPTIIANNNFMGVHQRVILMSDEESRECPSQEIGQVVRDDFFSMGIDERRGILQTQHVLQYKPFFGRVAGLRRHQSKAFRERRDSNSFDSHDSDDDDSVVFRDPQLCVSLPKLHHLNKPDRYLSPKASVMDIATGDNGKGTPGSNPTTGAQDNIRHNNKRPTPSPAMGVEPAPVSIAHLGRDRMNTEDQDAMDEETNYEGDDHSLLSSSRRVSLSPLSRRLALQFDSISILAPVKPSRSKRRKTFDTSLQC